MRTVGKPLLAMTADDLMSRALVVIPEEMSLQCAARLLRQSQVTGAPVVNSEGRCVGVLSATDFLRWAEGMDRSGNAGAERCPAQPCVCADWQVLDADELPAEEVRRYMTPDPVMTDPATPIGRLAWNMVDAHIHRIIVVDAQRRPIGIVSSTDILAAVAYADGLPAGKDADPTRFAPWASGCAGCGT
jgi:CBS domain-containing protein